ncbi:MAG TPA: hypothetical protein VM049_00045 [Gaiellaceae bacterium]|nr:hypothetical protein [Gaiellaceae bacterium]
MRSVDTRWLRPALLACVVVACGSAGAAGAAGPPVAGAVQLTALTGPQGADLYIEAPPGTAAFEHVHVQIRAPEGSDEQANRIINLKDVAAPGGVARIDLGLLNRGATVSAQAHVREQSPVRTAIHRGETVVRLRPDLVVVAVHAPPQTLSTRPIDVVADISELNLETGARATVKLMLGPTPVAEPQTVTVPAGGSLSLPFRDVKLTSAASVELTVAIDGAAPFETDQANNARKIKVEVTEHELVRSNVLVQALGGYGAQFNQHVYAPVTNPPVASLPDLEAKVKALEPQLVRIFYNDNFEERQPNRVRNLQSFVDTVELAQEAGATINITYQAVDVAKGNPVGSMARFAGVLEDLVEVKGFTAVRWVTVGNEPNSTAVTMAQYEALYRALDHELVARGLDGQIKLMGGDLIRNNQRVWFQYIATHMNDVLDAYSVHIYWDYWDPGFMLTRLKDVRQIVTAELPVEARKPTYVTESGIRGIINMPGKPATDPGYWQDGTQISRTNIAAFQQLWFDLASAQLGFPGSVKWDAYWGRYTTTYNEAWYLIGPAAEGWPLFPSYHALRLLLQTTQQGWQVVQVAPWDEDDWKLSIPDQAEKEIAGYADEAGHLTLMGLDSHGRDLNAASADPAPVYSIGGLPPDTTFNLALWNATGDGLSSVAGTIATGPAGVARFQVPLHAAFSLTTVPVS